MSHSGEPFDKALEAICHELTAARMPQVNPTLESIQSRIKELKKKIDSPDAVQRVRQLRADLMAYLQQIEKNTGAATLSAQKVQMNEEQQQAVDQRISACLEYALGQVAREKKPAPGGLAWLARLRV